VHVDAGYLYYVEFEDLSRAGCSVWLQLFIGVSFAYYSTAMELVQLLLACLLFVLK